MRQVAGTVVLGVIGNDIHVVANRLLDICLRAAGFHVVNLGANNRPEDFVDAALECDANAVLVGSLNGEAPHWCSDFRKLFIERGMKSIVLYLGGNLATGDTSGSELEQMFARVGFDRVFPGATDFDMMIEQLREDIRGNAIS